MDVQQEKLTSFCALTSADVEVAKRFLSVCGYDVSTAINKFFAFNGDVSKLEPAQNNDNMYTDKQNEILSTFISIFSTDTQIALQFLSATAWDLQTAMDRYFAFNGDPTNLNPNNLAAPLIIQEPPQPPPPQQCGYLNRNVNLGKHWKASGNNNANFLAALFCDPDYKFNGSLGSASKLALTENKWILINIQCPDNFCSHCLNRDVWKDKEISETIKESFVFYQQCKSSKRGKQIINLYKDQLKQFPSIFVIDPNTFKIEWQFMVPQEPNNIIKLKANIFDFLDAGKHTLQQPPHDEEEEEEEDQEEDQEECEDEWYQTKDEWYQNLEKYLNEHGDNAFTPPPKQLQYNNNDANSTDDGSGSKAIKSRPLRPNVSNDPTLKSWVCQICNAINNLQKSVDRDFVCLQCDGQYEPGQELIDARDEDKPFIKSSAIIYYQIWTCHKCTWQNDMQWLLCGLCNHNRPLEGLNIHYADKQPRFASAEEQNIQKHRNVYESNLSKMGVVKKSARYPSFDGSKGSPRLINIFGALYRNKYLSSLNTFDINNDIQSLNSFLTVQSHTMPTAATRGRGIAINEKTGWIAALSACNIWILSPNGSLSYNCECIYELEEKYYASDLVKYSNWRIRFVDNNIFVFISSTKKILHFLLNNGKLTLIQIIFDDYFMETNVKDIIVTSKVLIVLFSQWCGVYKLYPKFEWYHAISFAQKDVDSFSFEMITYDDALDDDEEEKYQQIKHKASYKNYIFINTQNALIAIHPVSPKFEFLHIASNVLNGETKFCISKQYGTFYISNERDQIFLSRTVSKSRKTICEINDNLMTYCQEWKDEKENDKKNVKKLEDDITAFDNVVYDEGYGISGRLLINCVCKKKLNKNERILYQMFNHNELSLLKRELMRNDYYLMPGTNCKPFNLIVYVFEMLYGEDFIDLLLQSPTFNVVGELSQDKSIDIDIEQEGN